jgi:hypothetical protein
MRSTGPPASPSPDPIPIPPADQGNTAAETPSPKGDQDDEAYDALGDSGEGQERLTERMVRNAQAHRSLWRRIFG